MKWNLYHEKRNGGLVSHEILPGEKYSPLFYLLSKFQKACQSSNLSPSHGHASRRYFEQPSGFSLQYHCEANDGHLNSTQQTNPRGTHPSTPSYLNKKYKISSDIQAE
jgi:hypothetical protein